MAQLKILGITGMPGAGKTTIALYVSNRLSIPTFSMGDVIREKSVELGFGLDKESQRRVVKMLREQGGKEIVARLTLDKIARSGSELIIIDGIRSMDEVEFFRKKAKMIILALHASPRRRYSLLRNRGRNDDPKNLNEFLERDRLELELGIGSVIAIADFMIVNEFLSLDELYREFDHLQDKILEYFNQL
ncbi:MAG: AAA family ATPase [Nitrososphaeria archaeon]